jgi:acetyl esterase/lipase
VRGASRRRVAYGGASSQHGALWRPREADPDVALPVVVLYHGGYWRAPYTKRLMDRLARSVVDQGWAAWNVEYRRVGVGGRGGGWPATYEDALAALRTVGRLDGVDPGRVVTCGHSAGGHLALWATAASRRGGDLVDGKLMPRRQGAVDAPSRIVPVAAISLAGVLDLAAGDDLDLGRGAVRHLMGGSPAARPDRYRQASLADALPLGVPQLVLHGTADSVVPPSLSQDYARRATDAGDAVDLVLVDEDHRRVIDPRSDAWRRALDTIHRAVA